MQDFCLSVSPGFSLSLSLSIVRKHVYALTGQELFKCKRDVSITIFIISFENVRHALQSYTALYKNIEAHIR